MRSLSPRRSAVATNAVPRSSVAPEAPPSPRRVAAIVGVLSLAVFMSSLDLFIVNLAFPYIGRDFRGASLSSLSWVLNGYTIVFAAVLVPAGRYADRVGRRRLFVAGLVVFSVGSLLCGVAPGVPELIGARVIQAVGAGLMVPASLSLLLASVPTSARAQAIGTWSALGALGAALGPVIGGSLVEINWRWVFWINLPVGLVAVLLATRIVPESRDERVQGRPDLIGAGLLAAAVGLVALALVEAPAWGWGSAGFIGLLAASVACGAGMIVRSGRHHSPVIELTLLRHRSFSGTFLASILYYAAFGAFVLNSVEFLTGVWHYSAVRAGLAIGPGPLMVLPFARLVAPRLAARIGGPGRVAALGCALNACAQLLWLTQIQSHPAYLTHLLPAQLLGGAGVGLTIPSMLAAGSASLSPARFGTGSGILNMARQVGTVLGVASLVAILAHVDPADPVATFRHGLILIIAFFAAAGVVSALLLGGRPVAVPAGAGPPSGAAHDAATPDAALPPSGPAPLHAISASSGVAGSAQQPLPTEVAPIALASTAALLRPAARLPAVRAAAPSGLVSPFPVVRGAAPCGPAAPFPVRGAAPMKPAAPFPAVRTAAPSGPAGHAPVIAVAVPVTRPGLV